MIYNNQPTNQASISVFGNTSNSNYTEVALKSDPLIDKILSDIFSYIIDLRDQKQELMIKANKLDEFKFPTMDKGGQPEAPPSSTIVSKLGDLRDRLSIEINGLREVNQHLSNLV